VIPNTSYQDTVGPITRTVTDAAMLLDVLAGSDPADARTSEADARKTDYISALRPDALKGARIGVLRGMRGSSEAVQPLFDAALNVLKAEGAELVELPPGGGLEDINPEALTAEAWNFKHDMAAYLAAAPPAVKVRTVEDLLAFHKTDPRESKIGVQYWEESAAATGGFENPKYIELMKYLKRESGPQGYAGLFTQHNLNALVSPAGAPAELIPADGISRPDQRKKGAPSLTWHAAVGGYPLLTVPMGVVGGMPVGLSFVGPQ
jgi:amidase